MDTEPGDAPEPGRGTGALAAMLLTDGRLPSGGYSYSAGLEPGLEDDLRGADVPAYMAARLRTVARVEAAAVLLAHRAAAGDPAGLAAVHDALLARTPSAPLREASSMLGRGLVRLITRLRPDDPAVRVLRGIGRAPQRPVVFGVCAAVLGVDEVAAVRASFYDDVQTVAAATLKLAPVDPVEPVAWLLGTADLIDELTAQTLSIETVEQMPAVTAPQAEQWSLDHQNRTRRIFVA